MCENTATGGFIRALSQFSHLGGKDNNQALESFISNPDTDSACGFGQAT